MRTTTVTVSACLLAATFCRADVLDVGKKQIQGTFVGYEKNEFQFRAGEGKVTKHPRASAGTLTLDTPVEVSLLRFGKKEPENCLLVGYKQSTFTFDLKGKKIEAPGMHVVKILVTDDIVREGGGAGAGGATMAIDTAALEQQALSPEQAAALKRYKAAAQGFDAYVARSSALVAQMDRASGGSREKLLNELRMRKNEEQPLKRELEGAQGALLRAFPALTGGQAPAQNGKVAPVQPEPAVPVAVQPAAPAPAVAPDAAAKKEEQKFSLVDTSMLEKMGGLTAVQSAVLGHCKTVQKEYMDFASTPHAIPEPPEYTEKLQKLTAAVKEAQTALLQAFPGLSIEAK